MTGVPALDDDDADGDDDELLHAARALVAAIAANASPAKRLDILIMRQVPLVISQSGMREAVIVPPDPNDHCLPGEIVRLRRRNPAQTGRRGLIVTKNVLICHAEIPGRHTWCRYEYYAHTVLRLSKGLGLS
jgi:hypothetical protein